MLQQYAVSSLAKLRRDTLQAFPATFPTEGQARYDYGLIVFLA